jgi:hypothetical protein
MMTETKKSYRIEEDELERLYEAVAFLNGLLGVTGDPKDDGTIRLQKQEFQQLLRAPHRVLSDLYCAVNDRGPIGEEQEDGGDAA